MRNICCQSTIRNLHGATTFYNLRFPACKRHFIKVFCTQPQQPGTWTQPSHGDLQRLSCKTHNRITHNGYTNCSPKTGTTPKRKNVDFETLLKRIFKRKIISAKMKKQLLPKHPSHLSCCHYMTIYDSQLQNTIVLRTHPQQRETLTQPFHSDVQRLSCQT